MSTIAAISTAQAGGGIGVIRISGEDAAAVADRVFSAADGVSLSVLPGYRAKFGHIVREGIVLDQCVALVFRAPHSYTGENVVELSCHGGVFLLRQTLEALFENGAVPAQAGEFTKRAYLNGKMDLTQAEAVMTLIGAQGEQAAAASAGALEGALRVKIEEILDRLTSCSADMAAWVDYPDEEIPELEDEQLIGTLLDIQRRLEALLNNYTQGQIILEGADTVIAGRPNAGKSTLMNLLAGKEKSIVTHIAGTTRDIVEDTVHFGNVVLHLSDTAGIRESGDVIEAMGVSKALERLETAQLIYAVFDSSEDLAEEDWKLIEKCKNKAAIAVVNKTDLAHKAHLNFPDGAFSAVVHISAKTGEGRKALLEATERLLGTRDFNPSAAVLANERQRSCCKRALECVSEAVQAARAQMTRDAVNVSVDCAANCLLELTGGRATEQVVENIFSRFCVGK